MGVPALSVPGCPPLSDGRRAARSRPDVAPGLTPVRGLFSAPILFKAGHGVAPAICPDDLTDNGG